MSDEIRRLRREETFSIVPHWLLFSGVSAGAIQLFAVLWSYANPDGTGACPNQSTLGERVGRTKDTVRRWTRELIEVGAIEVEERVTAAGDPDSHAYTLRLSPPNTRAGGTGTDAGTPCTDKGGVPESMQGGTRTDAGRGTGTDRAQPIPLLPKHSSSSPSVGNGGSTDAPDRGGGGVGYALTEDPEAFDAVVRWCQIRGQVVNDVTVARFLPDARAFIAAGGVASDAFLRQAADVGINSPRGWAFVPGAIAPTLSDVADCGRCDNRRLVGVLEDSTTVSADHPDATQMVPCPDCRSTVGAAAL